MTFTAETISLIISLSAFAASIIFFYFARESETHTIELLAQIDQQTKTLKNINDNLLDKAIQHLASSNFQLIDKMFTPSSGHELPKDALSSTSLEVDEYTQLIYIYYYTARTNYFARNTSLYVPFTAQTKSIHDLATESIRLSREDFITVSALIKNLDQTKLKEHPLYQTVLELQTIWEPHVTSVET